MAYTKQETLLDAVTIDGVSNYVAVGDRTKLSLQVKCEDHAAGSGAFSVEICNGDPDVAENWTVYNRLTRNVTNTNAQQDTRVASLTLSADGTDFLFFPPGDHFEYMRVRLDVTTDGAYSAILHSVVP